MRALVAVDITARPEDVVKHAAVWAERVGASLDLVYVDEIAARAPDSRVLCASCGAAYGAH
jgi:nucleotide-binding universal stress UspA family protein